MDRIGWVAGATTIVRDSLMIKPGELVLIVGDTTTHRIVEMFAYVVAAAGANPVECIMQPTGRHGAEPPKTVGSAMKDADVLILATAYSMTHTNARREANAAGARIASMPGATRELFEGGGLEVDVIELAKTVERVGRRLQAARHARITAPNGTDMQLQLDGAPPANQTGVCHEPGTWGGLAGIETAIVPVPGSSSGVWMLDGTIAQMEHLVKEPVRVLFDAGRINEIEGGADASLLREYLESFNDPGVYEVVEMGIGLNPKAKMWRSYTESEAEFGTMHLGIGDGTSFGSPHRAATHTDLVIRHPILELDGIVVLENNKLVAISGGSET
jgi:leucyl aminopeptidase (aminopeptidase T)